MFALEDLLAVSGLTGPLDLEEHAESEAKAQNPGNLPLC